jgi:hypothetical protein
MVTNKATVPPQPIAKKAGDGRPGDRVPGCEATGIGTAAARVRGVRCAARYYLASISERVCGGGAMHSECYWGRIASLEEWKLYCITS